MADKTRQIKLTAHKAISNKDEGGTFEEIIRSIQIKSNGHQDRTAVFASKKNTVISKFTDLPGQDGIGASFDIYEPGSHISTILFADDRNEVGDGILPPPEKSEFLIARVSIFAVDDHIICANLGTRNSTIPETVREVAQKQGIIDRTTMLGFSRLPSPGVLDRINRIGVKSVTFDASSYLGKGLSSGGGGIVDMVFGKISSANALTRRRMATAKLVLNARTRLHGRKKIDFDYIERDAWLDKVAKEALEDDDVSTYNIILNDKTVIRSNNIELSKSVAVRKSGTTFDVAHAHHEMLSFYNEIKLRSSAE